ncbi:aminoglycoside adenylyltransferase domain-containing protein [Kytococcus sedentarius]|uniref:aminoglycoside adenylyltransferase domain-containing protein n=1 Tax=Kytococcus sedentarius TaxID=1276 RepID=UPI0035BC74B8
MTPWARDGELVAQTCRDHLPGAAVYVHGSAALGGFSTASDLDVLVVADEVPAPEDLAAHLLRLPTTHPLELSVVTPDAAREPRAPWPYLLHVASPDRHVTDPGAGDPDLIAHYAVTRQSGIALIGPPPDELIGPVDHGTLLAHLADELRWGLTHADQRYAVLNACRAVVAAREQRLVSKIDGGRWWMAQRGPDPLVAQALAAQRAGNDLGPCTAAARRFVTTAAGELTD